MSFINISLKKEINADKAAKGRKAENETAYTKKWCKFTRGVKI